MGLRHAESPGSGGGRGHRSRRVHLAVVNRLSCHPGATCGGGGMGTPLFIEVKMH